MIVDDENFLRYALRSVHLAEECSWRRVARADAIGIAKRVVNELQELKHISFDNGKQGFHLTRKGRKALKELGGPFPNWRGRSKIYGQAEG